MEQTAVGTVAVCGGRFSPGYCFFWGGGLFIPSNFYIQYFSYLIKPVWFKFLGNIISHLSLKGVTEMFLCLIWSVLRCVGSKWDTYCIRGEICSVGILHLPRRCWNLRIPTKKKKNTEDVTSESSWLHTVTPTRPSWARTVVRSWCPEGGGVLFCSVLGDMEANGRPPPV